MHFRQFYLGCLAHASYVVGDGGECAIVDPQRDVDQYIEEARAHDLKIRYIIETHLHADFVSGHRELAQRTGAEIVIGARANATFPHLAVQDGMRLSLGGVELVALETPGHTPESISWLLVENGTAVKVLTGDTLFIGDVGRPDLAGSRGFTPQSMAAMLYDSLHSKLLTLPDDVEVWPAHGAGSACGKNISRETSSTIGQQRRMNYALQPMSSQEFVTLMTADLADPPPYFSRDAEINRSGAGALAEGVVPALTATAAAALIAGGAVGLDVREAAAFGASHVPGSINVGLGGQFASWCGTLLSFDDRIIIIADSEDHAREAVMRLGRVGMENIAGWIDGGATAWSNAGFASASLTQLAAADLREQIGNLRVLDVRAPSEYASGHVPGARNVPLNQLGRRLSEIRWGAPTAVICAGGYRSSAAASLLARNGFSNLVNVVGGVSGWVRAGFDLES
jgi:hydroxyacylglutathione hydrolase